MKLANVVALILAFRGVWGVFSAARTWKRGPHWAPRRVWIVALEGSLVVSCWLPAAGLHFGWFAPWMAAPLGACFLLSLPLPCMFEAVDRIRWLHALRNGFFILVALLCFSIAAGFLSVPLRPLR